MERFDLIVIGGGPAGYLAGERAGAAGLRTAVIEKRFLGGVCLNEGCIPSKAFLHSAKVYDSACHGDKYGVTVRDVSIDHAKVVARKNKVVKVLVSGISAQLKRCGVTVIQGEAIIGGKRDNGFAVRVGDSVYETEKLLLATGSVPVIPPIPGLREGMETGFVLTNREILDLAEAPGTLAVIGGGVVGLEMACYFSAIGVKVTVIELADKIAGSTDARISGILQKNSEKKGIDFRLGTRVVSIGTNTVICKKEGETILVPADKALLSVGRRALTDGLHLDTIGVYTPHGSVITDEYLRTNVPGVYAAGDINGKSMLAHTAYRESEVAVNHMLGKHDRMRYHAIPSVIYTSPEVASVGETEETALEKGYDIKTAVLPMRFSGRYLAEVEGGDGLVKLVADKKYNRLIGVHMIGSYASEIIYGAAMMIETEMTVNSLKEIVFPHPTICEVLHEALYEI